MIKVVSSILPSRGYVAMALWPFVFVRKENAGRFDDTALRHESIHLRQQAETLVIPFLLWYAVEYSIRLLCNGLDGRRAYRGMGFEREAYANEGDAAYLKNRKPYSWLKYIV